MSIVITNQPVLGSHDGQWFMMLMAISKTIVVD